MVGGMTAKEHLEQMEWLWLFCQAEAWDDAYQTGRDAGYGVGYEAGYDAGYDAGYEHGSYASRDAGQ